VIVLYYEAFADFETLQRIENEGMALRLGNGAYVYDGGFGRCF
jgi:hypothetical protein